MKTETDPTPETASAIDSNDLVACPFCGSDEIVIGKCYGISRQYFGACKYCGANGPKVMIEIGAAPAWNLRKATDKSEPEGE